MNGPTTVHMNRDLEEDSALGPELEAAITDAAEKLLSIHGRDIRRAEDRELFRRQLLPMFSGDQEWLVDLIILRAQTIEIRRRIQPRKPAY